jgi:solute carrier family 25 (mitochondrial phosphate transporter), member 23/24/25/41
MPAREHGSQLHAVISYYYSVVNVTPEGDSIVSEETLEGLGTAGTIRSLLQSLFGSFYRLAFPPGSAIHHPEPRQKSSTVSASVSQTDALPRSQQRMDAAEVMSPAAVDAALVNGEARQTVVAGVRTQHVVNNTSAALDEESSIAAAAKTKKKFKLTDFVPDPGYFLAGAAAGGVSRTATAPFDRLKVYLLVNTNARDSEAIASVIRQARPLSIFQRVTKPLTDGIRDIYRSGGFKGFFAGRSCIVVGGRLSRHSRRVGLFGELTLTGRQEMG